MLLIIIPERYICERKLHIAYQIASVSQPFFLQLKGFRFIYNDLKHKRLIRNNKRNLTYFATWFFGNIKNLRPWYFITRQRATYSYSSIKFNSHMEQKPKIERERNQRCHLNFINLARSEIGNDHKTCLTCILCILTLAENMTPTRLDCNSNKTIVLLLFRLKFLKFSLRVWKKIWFFWKTRKLEKLLFGSNLINGSISLNFDNMTNKVRKCVKMKHEAMQISFGFLRHSIKYNPNTSIYLCGIQSTVEFVALTFVPVKKFWKICFIVFLLFYSI